MSLSTTRTTLLYQFWFLLSILVGFISYQQATAQLESQVKKVYQPFIESVLESRIFDNKVGNITDTRSLIILAQDINDDPITTQEQLPLWQIFSTFSIKLVKIDGIEIYTSELQSEFIPINFNIYRNEKNRPIHLEVVYSINWFFFVGLASLLLLVVVVIDRNLMKPVTEPQRQWMNKLIAMGYHDDEALKNSQFTMAEGFLNIHQDECFNLFHNKKSKNFTLAYSLASSSELAQLSNTQFHWFKLTVQLLKDEYKDNNALFSEAIQIAHLDNSLEIIPHKGQELLQIHGLKVSMDGTELAYYAWYVKQRLKNNDNEGWMPSPQSNKPDTSEVRDELVSAFYEWGVHQKTINQLEDKGIIASRLADNRSKAIKVFNKLTELYDFPSELLHPYLIEQSEKQNKSGVYSFRINLTHKNIKFL